MGQGLEVQCPALQVLSVHSQYPELQSLWLASSARSQATSLSDASSAEQFVLVALSQILAQSVFALQVSPLVFKQLLAPSQMQLPLAQPPPVPLQIPGSVPSTTTDE